jgi:hypothetical protein
MIRALFCLTLFSGAALADPPAVVPVPRDKPGEWAEVKATPGRLLVLAAEPASKWLLVDDEAADMRVFDAGKHAAFVAPAAGRVKVVVTGPDGTAARVVVVVGDGPPDPGPGPGPKPPVPPPADPLRVKLKTAFDADGAAPELRRNQAKDLAALYREAGKLCVSPDVQTAGDLLARVKAASASMVGPDALKGVRTAVAGELALLFPTDGPLGAVDSEPRKKAAALFTKLAVILDELGA